MNSPPQRGMCLDGYVVTAARPAGRHATVLQARDAGGSFVALKLATSRVGDELVAREARVLAAPGAVAGGAPRLAGAGTVDGRPYYAAGWVPGVAANVAAAEARAPGGGVLGLCRAVAAAYAALHDAGVVHGQVNPRHVLADGDGSVRLLDLSLATAGEDAPPPVYFSLRLHALGAPELAAALLDGEAPAMSAAAEQYSVAALLYLLATGRMYARLRLERAELLGDIVASPMLSFAERGAAPWPELEEVLRRALDKEPAARFASVAELAAAVEAVRAPSAAAATTPPPTPAPLAEALREFRRAALDPRAVGGLAAPTCSVNFGAAGVAFALTRLGRVTRDAAALDAAERWLAWAELHQDDADAFDDGDELTPGTVGLVSPYHTRSGVAAVRALHSAATGDAARQQAALDDFRAATALPCAELDLTLGRSAVLLFAALLYASADPAWPAARRLRDHGENVARGIWRDLGEAPPLYHGMAHGSAGLAYASLVWTQALGTGPAPGVRALLDELAAAAEPWECGVRWPLTGPEGHAGDEFWPGWCHGNAGYVFLWNLAHATYGDGAFAQLAERAAWLATGPAGVDNLCCGSAGQSYALLRHGRRGGGAAWLARAAELASAAAGDASLRHEDNPALSLYKGRAGLALLAADLGSPDGAAMPLFEPEPRAGQT